MPNEGVKENILREDILESGNCHTLKKASKMETRKFSLPIEAWVRILDEPVATFHHWPISRNKLIDLWRKKRKILQRLRTGSQGAEGVKEMINGRKP